MKQAGEPATEQAETRQEARLPLQVLQAQLARRAWGLDAYWLPRTDPFMSEYLPPEAERLAFLTGFEGSAGTLVFTADRAVLFVDGRYDLQARQQFATFPVPIEVLRIETTRPQDWLAEQASLRTIGYDPALFSQEQVSRLGRFFESHKKSFQAVEPNLVDALWTSRPGPSQEAIWEHDLRWAGESSADKTERVCRILRDKGVAGFLFSLSDSIAWLTNKRGGDVPFTPVFQSYYALFEDGQAVWFVDEKRLTSQARGTLDPRVQVVPPSSFDAYWAARASCRLGVDPKSLSSRVYQTLAERLTLIDMPEPVQPLKAVKNETEQRAVREAHCQDGVALVRFLAWLEAHGPSTDEWACVEYLETCRRRNPNYMGPELPHHLWGRAQWRDRSLSGDASNQPPPPRRRRLSGGFGRAVCLRHDRCDADGCGRVSPAARGGSARFHARPEGTYCSGPSCFSARHAGESAGRAGTSPALARRRRLCARDGARRGVPFIRPRGAAESFASKHLSACAWDGALQRARLLSSRSVRHPDREPHAGPRMDREIGRRAYRIEPSFFVSGPISGPASGRPRHALFRDAYAGPHRPAPPREGPSGRRGIRLARRLSPARSAHARPAPGGR